MRLSKILRKQHLCRAEPILVRHRNAATCVDGTVSGNRRVIGARELTTHEACSTGTRLSFKFYPADARPLGRLDDWTIVICYGAVQFGDPRSRTSNSSFEMSLLFRVPFHASPPQATDSPWIQSSIGKSHVARESQALHQFPIEALPSFHRLRLPRKICTCDRDSVQIDCLMTIHRKYRCFDRPRPKITSFR